jgi:glycosyltransferase involved in cell wall biosynthesis
MLQQMKDVAQNCSNILFLGQRSDIVKILRISDCFISAADSEGLPNTVLEAMSTDLVPILSDIPPHREILAKLNDNQTFTFPVGDVAILSERLNQFAYSKSVFSKGFIREYIDQNFSAVKTSSSYLDLYGKAEGI